MISILDRMHKTCSGVVTNFLDGFQWGYEKRYLYHLDGVEKKNNGIYILLHVRGKRTGCKIPMSEVENDKIITEIHPVDAFVIGMLSVSTKKIISNFIDNLFIDLKNNRINITTVKNDIILKASKISCKKMHKDKIMIHHIMSDLSSSIEIDLDDIASYSFLLSGLGSRSAFKIGQETTRKLLSNEKDTKH